MPTFEPTLNHFSGRLSTPIIVSGSLATRGDYGTEKMRAIIEIIISRSKGEPPFYRNVGFPHTV